MTPQTTQPESGEKQTLLPCPFCGGEAGMEEISIYGGIRFSVGCATEHEATCMGYQSLTSFARRGDAAEAWNTRALLSQQSARIEELEKVLKPFADYSTKSFLPDGFIITKGSKLASRQLTIGDCRTARAALNSKATP